MVRSNEQHRIVIPPPDIRAGRFALRSILAVALLVWFSGSARALIVGATPNVIPNTSTAPVDNPGYLNAVRTGNFVGDVCVSNCLNGVYLGDGWILSAKHTGFGGVRFDHLSASFNAIPNQQYLVPNPTGQGLSESTDLRMYRIKGDASVVDPGLPSLTIASQPLALNDEVTMIAYGVTRTPDELHFSVNGASPPVWTQVPNSNTYNGYGNGASAKRWGTNHIADDNAVLNESDANLTGVLHVNAGDVICYVTTFDQNSSNPYEAQAVGGDSGSGVFHKYNGQWQLSGITFANLIFPGQSVSGGFNSANSLAIYGNATAFVDLNSYCSQILSIMAAHADYSIAGDVNMDGIVSGDGTGPAATDDITAFVQGWRYDNFSGQGSLLSWSKGDLNHDGKVNASDFFKLRQAFGATGSSALASAFNSLAVGTLGLAIPESSTIALLLLAVGAMLSRRSRASM